MHSSLTEITGDRLKSLVSDLMVRKGYTVEQDPRSYSDLDVLAVKPEISNGVNKYFIVTAGRKTNKYLTKGDVMNALPDPISLSETSRLLLVTTRRSSSREARRVASTDPTKKKVWYIGNLLEQLREVNSEYLVDLYNDNKSAFDTKEDLDTRFNYQGIRVREEKIDYISSETHHPRKIVAYIELKSNGVSNPVVDSPSVVAFRQEFESKTS